MPCLLGLFFACLFLFETEGHGLLKYPPPRTGTDANVRNGPCGGVAAKTPGWTFYVGDNVTLVFNIEANHGGSAKYQLVYASTNETEDGFSGNTIVPNIPVGGLPTGDFKNNFVWTRECAHCIIRWAWTPGSEATDYYGCTDITVLTRENPAVVELKVTIAQGTDPASVNVQNALQSALNANDMKGTASTPVPDSLSCTKSGVSPCNIFFVNVTFEKYVSGDSVVTAASQTTGWTGTVPREVTALLASSNLTATPAAASSGGGGTSGMGDGKSSKTNSTAAGVMIPIVFLVAAAIAYLLVRPFLTTLGTNWTISNEKMHYFLWSWVFAWFVIFLLDAVSVASTQWSYYGSWELGLWKTCVGGDCSNNVDVNFPLKANIDATRAFMILAVLTSVVAFGATLAAALGRAPHRSVAFGSYVIGIILFCLNFMSMCVYGAWNNDYLSKNISGIKYGYGFGLTILVWIMSIAMAMFSFFLFVKFGLGAQETPKEAAPAPAATPAEAETAGGTQEDETQQV